MAARKKRAGKTETFSVSVDAATKEQLKAAADRLHNGNMSRLFTAVARRLTEDAAFERAWQWYGGAPPSYYVTSGIDALIDSVVEARKRKKNAG